MEPEEARERDIRQRTLYLSMKTDTSGSESTGVFEHLKEVSDFGCSGYKRAEIGRCVPEEAQEGEASTASHLFFAATDPRHKDCDVRIWSFQGTAEQRSGKYMPEEGYYLSENLRRGQNRSFLRYENWMRRPACISAICNSIFAATSTRS